MIIFKAPEFWNEDTLCSRILVPFSYLYNFFSKLIQKRTKTTKLSVPVICVGNIVMGGAGKTPTVMALVDILKDMGHTPHIISRGYGAIVKGLKRVEFSRHHYLQVGDEPLLLSKVAPTWVSSNRIKAGNAAIAEGATILLMDDGLQNMSIHKDFNIIVVDSYQKFGNNRVFPAGPLREPLEDGLKKADLVLVIGESAVTIPEGHHVICARFKAETTPKKVNDRIIGFAGLGYPEKFKITLINSGYKVVDFITYPDHYPYTITELEKLVKKAKSKKAYLMTTSKDAIRLPNNYKEKVSIFNVKLEFNDTSLLQQALCNKISCR